MYIYYAQVEYYLWAANQHVERSLIGLSVER